MKKFAIIAILTAATVTASATEIGARVGHTGSTGANSVGVMVEQNVSGIDAEFAIDRSTAGKTNVNRVSAVATRQVAQYAGVDFDVKAGVAYVDPTHTRDGFAAVVGLGASYPVTKEIALVADYQYQSGQHRIRKYNGSAFYVGALYSF